jgi:hypothetical protein
MLLIIVEDVDRWEDQPLHEAIVRTLLRLGVAGATAWPGIAGYGSGARLHHGGLFGVSDEKPILIAAIDTEEKLRAVASSITPMVKGGLILLQDTELLTDDSRPGR